MKKLRMFTPRELTAFTPRERRILRQAFEIGCEKGEDLRDKMLLPVGMCLWVLCLPLTYLFFGRST